MLIVENLPLLTLLLACVADLPDSGPVIRTEKDRYEAGEVLRANCTSPPSKPPASLSFLLNNHPVPHSSHILTVNAFIKKICKENLVLTCWHFIFNFTSSRVMWDFRSSSNHVWNILLHKVVFLGNSVRQMWAATYFDLKIIR